MRIGVISQYFPPEGAAAFYAASVAEGLAERGHEVRVLTGFPNYPSGTIFPGHRQRWRHREAYGGAQVLRVPLYIDHSPSGLKRMINYISFGLSAASAMRWLAGVDVIYVYATQMTPAIGPWLRRAFRGRPYVLHVQDLWPDSITGSTMVQGRGSRRLIEALLNPWLRSVYRGASAVIAIAPRMMDTLRSRGVPAEKLHMVYNWADEPDEPHAALAESHSNTTEFLYAGNVGDMQDVETVIRAAQLARNSGVHVRIVGDGVALQRVKTLARELEADNVTFEGRVPMTDVARFYAAADFALITLRDLPTFRGTIPSKFQAAIAHGLPVVTTVQGDLSDLVARHGLGYTSAPESPTSLADTLVAAASSSYAQRGAMGERAAAQFAAEFSTQAGLDTLEAILADTAEFASARRFAHL